MLTFKGRFYKNTYKTNRILMIFEVRGVEKSIKNQSKIDQKMKSPWEGLLDSIFLDFDGFSVDFWSIFRPPEHQKSLKFYWFYRYFCKIGLSKLTSIFAPILVPTWLHFPSQNLPKSHQKSILEGIDFSIDFCIDFFTIFGRLGRPSWSHVGHFFGTRRLPRRIQIFVAFWSPTWGASNGFLRGLAECAGLLGRKKEGL